MHRLSERVVESIRAERQSGKSARDIVVALAKRGVKVSVGSVHSVVTGAHPVAAKSTPSASSSAGVKHKPAKRSPAVKAKTKGGEVPGIDLAGPPEDADIATLDRWISQHEQLATKAKTDGDLSGYAAVHRLLQKALENRRKFRPPPAPDDGATPDMVRVGQEAVKKLHEMVDKALGAPEPA